MFSIFCILLNFKYYLDNPICGVCNVHIHQQYINIKLQSNKTQNKRIIPIKCTTFPRVLFLYSLSEASFLKESCVYTVANSLYPDQFILFFFVVVVLNIIETSSDDVKFDSLQSTVLFTHLRC